LSSRPNIVFFGGWARPSYRSGGGKTFKLWDTATEAPIRTFNIGQPRATIRELNLYLKDWATNTRIKTVADIVAFNETNAEKALRFGQDLFLAANLTKDDLSEL
jgi:hypothetical protein